MFSSIGVKTQKTKNSFKLEWSESYIGRIYLKFEGLYKQTFYICIG